MVTTSLAVTVNVPAVVLLMVTVKVAVLPEIVKPLTVGVRPPLTVTVGVPKLGVPVAAGKALMTVTVKTYRRATRQPMTGVSGVMPMRAST